jgi:release factor glutamine methyltransferase
MIPRVGSETVVQRAIALYNQTLPLRSYTDTPMVLDLGTGSGCLLLSILDKMLNAFGVGLELSPAAIEIAEYNASALGLKSRCNLYEGEFNQPNDISEEPFDIVVSNPPYHTQGGRKSLDASCVAHEPHMALFIEHTNMLKHYREIMIGLEQTDMVKPGTVLVFEVFKDNANGVADLMRELKLEEIQISHDARGCVRTVEGIYPPAPIWSDDEWSDDDCSYC